MYLFFKRLKFSKNFIFLFFIFLFLSSFLLINFIYEKYVLEEKFLFQSNEVYLDYIKNNSNKEIEYAFFGDSHTMDGVNPFYINNSYNFATSGENYLKSYYKFKKILNKDNVTIKNVILEIDMHTFSSLFVDDVRLLKEVDFYSNFLDYSEMMSIRNDSYFKIFILDHFPIIGNGNELGYLLIKPKKTEIFKGWAKNEHIFKRGEEGLYQAKNVFKKQFINQKRIDNISFEYFKKFLILAEKNNITVILIKYPISNEYDKVLIKNNIDKLNYYSYIFNETKEITKKKIILLDYYNYFFNNSNLFGDSTHLNFKGAKNLSQKINHDLISLN